MHLLNVPRSEVLELKQVGAKEVEDAPCSLHLLQHATMTLIEVSEGVRQLEYSSRGRPPVATARARTRLQSLPIKSDFA